MIYIGIVERTVMSQDIAVCKWGNALGVRLPKESCIKLGIRAGDHVSAEVTETDAGPGLLLQKTEKPFSLEALFEGYEGEYRPELLDWGTPVGREAWL
jgi:antitoxin MazE